MSLEISFAVALLLAQLSLPDVIATPSTLAEQRATVALTSAEDGRELARRFICSKEERYRRLLERDDTFLQLKSRFLRYFGHEWRNNSYSDTLTDRSNDLGRRDDCKLRDSFEAGLNDYDNGLLAAETQLKNTGFEIR